MKRKKQEQSPSSPLHKAIGLTARILVGGVLVYAGFSKLIGPTAEFAAAMDAYRILPTQFVIEFAGVIPWIELYVGLFLVFGYVTKLSVKTSLVLVSIFLVVLLQAFLRGIDPASCGCFGEGLNLTLPQAILADSILFGFSFYLVRKPSQFFTLDGWIKKGN